MDNQLCREILKNRDIKRQRKIDEAIIKKRKIYKDYPELEEIEKNINLLALKITRNIVASDEITRQVEKENMKSKLDKMEEKKKRILKKIGITEADLEPDFDCKICNDTGMVTKDNITSYCNCFKQEVLNNTYKQSNILKLEEENLQLKVVQDILTKELNVRQTENLIENILVNKPEPKELAKKKIKIVVKDARIIINTLKKSLAEVKDILELDLKMQEEVLPEEIVLTIRIPNNARKMEQVSPETKKGK